MWQQTKNQKLPKSSLLVKRRHKLWHIRYNNCCSTTSNNMVWFQKCNVGLMKQVVTKVCICIKYRSSKIKPRFGKVSGWHSAWEDFMCWWFFVSRCGCMICSVFILKKNWSSPNFCMFKNFYYTSIKVVLSLTVTSVRSVNKWETKSKLNMAGGDVEQAEGVKKKSRNFQL